MAEIFVSIMLLLSYTIRSNNGVYRGTIVYGRDAHLAVESFTLYQNDELVYTREKPDVSTFFLGNTGKVFALNDKCLYLYSQSGEALLLKELNYPNGFGFSPDNLLFFASDKDGVFAYSENGALVYTFKPGRLFASTEQGKMVAIISLDTLFLYEDGIQKFQWQLRTPYARTVFFSKDEGTIVVEEPSENEIFNFYTGKKGRHE
jgi:hypothetical protein